MRLIGTASIIFGLAFTAGRAAAQDAGLPLEVRLDLITTRLDRSLRSEQYDNVVTALDDLESLGMPVSETSLFLRAKVLVEMAAAAEQTSGIQGAEIRGAIDRYYRNFGAAGAYSHALAQTVLENGPAYASSLPAPMVLGSLTDRLATAVTLDSTRVVAATLAALRTAGIPPTDESLEAESWSLFSLGRVWSAHRVARDYLRLVGRRGNNYQSILDRVLFIEDMRVFNTDFASDRPLDEAKSGSCRGWYEDGVYLISPFESRWCSKRIPAEAESGNFNVGATVEFAGEPSTTGSFFVDFGALEGRGGWSFWRFEVRSNGRYRLARHEASEDTWTNLIEWSALPVFSRTEPNRIELTVDQTAVSLAANDMHLGDVAVERIPSGSIWIGGQDEIEIAWHSVSLYRAR